MDDLNQWAVRQNVIRISYVSYAYVLYQILSLWRSGFDGMWVPVLISGMLCIACTAYTVFRFNSILQNRARAKRIVLLFWIMLSTLGATQLFTTGIHEANPFYLTVFLAVIASIPVFGLREILLVHPVLGGYHLLLTFLLPSSWNYRLLTLALSAAGGLLAVMLTRRCAEVFSLHAQPDEAAAPAAAVTTDFERMNTVIELCKRLGSNVCVYMIGIDFLKEFAAYYGQLRANQAMSESGGAIGRVFSRSSDIICRFSEDTFVICSSIANVRDAHEMARMLRASVEKLEIPAASQGVSPWMTASVGYTIYQPDTRTAGSADEDMDVLSLLEEAGDALAAAQFSGRNTVFSFIPERREAQAAPRVAS